MKKIAVICKGHEDFDNYLRDNFLNNDDKMFIPVFKEHHLRMVELRGILNTYHPMIDDPRKLIELCKSRLR